MTTEQLFVMFDGSDSNCDSVADDLDIMMHEADQSAAPPKSSSYTEEVIADALKTAHATKQFPPNIEHGSEFHLEFLYRHFTRKSPRSLTSKANKQAWKQVIAKHLDVLSDSIGKMRCEPFKFQTVPGTKPIRQRMYPLSLVKKGALVKMLKVLIDNDAIEACLCLRVKVVGGLWWIIES